VCGLLPGWVPRRCRGRWGQGGRLGRDLTAAEPAGIGEGAKPSKVGLGELPYDVVAEGWTRSRRRQAAEFNGEPGDRP
jgi:hypothetical protein